MGPQHRISQASKKYRLAKEEAVKVAKQEAEQAGLHATEPLRAEQIALEVKLNTLKGTIKALHKATSDSVYTEVYKREVAPASIVYMEEIKVRDAQTPTKYKQECFKRAKRLARASKLDYMHFIVQFPNTKPETWTAEEWKAAEIMSIGYTT